MLRRRDLPRRAKRDAVRALRGQVRRTELYALDGSARQARPFTVSRDVAERPRGDARRLFFPHLRGERRAEWERGQDPLTRFEFTDDYDAHGQPRLRTQVACPQGWRRLDDRPGRPYLATRTRTVFAAPPAAGPDIHDRVACETTWELANDGRLSLAELLDRPDASVAVVGQTLNFYDCDPLQPGAGAFTGLPLGQLGDYGALVRTERLALTDARLTAMFGSVPPSYLTAVGASPASAATAYPAEFLASLPPLAGYVDRRVGNGAPVVPGLFVAMERRRHDFHDGPAGRGLVVATRDALGNEATIAHDSPYRLLPTVVTDAVGNRKHVVHDYRTLQPRQVTDSNGNVTLCTFTPLGLVASIQLRGRTGTDGDQGRPSVQLHYDFHAFDRSRPDAPAHLGRDDPPAPPRHRARRPAPGAGRDDRVTRVLGWLRSPHPSQDAERGGSLRRGRLRRRRRYPAHRPIPGRDGRRVRPRESRPRPAQRARQRLANSRQQGADRRAVRAVLLGRLGVRGTRPGGHGPASDDRLRLSGAGGPVLGSDGSEQRHVPGIPSALDDPERYEPSAWEAYAYDANDSAGRTHPIAAAAYRGHWNTPSSTTLDALGRAVAQVRRNGPSPAPTGTGRSPTTTSRGIPSP